MIPDIARRHLFSSTLLLRLAAVPGAFLSGKASADSRPGKPVTEATGAEQEPVFAVGQPVRISVRYPWGHYRTPMYIRGKAGRIERVLPEFLNPEQEAYGKNAGTAVRLYRVTFDQRHIWPDYSGAPGDSLEIEMYEHWLEIA